MYTNTFKNELTTDQKHKLLLNTCGILFSCRNGAKILFLTSQSTIFRLCRDGSSWVEPVPSYD